MKKKKEGKEEDRRCCNTCEYLIPIGEGDFICEHNLIIVVSDYTPTDDYFLCGGKKWK